MKKIVIILLPLTALFSCQLQNKKPNQTISPVDKTPTSTNLDTQKVTTADELLASLHKCYQEEVCKTQLDDSFNKWLIENKFISNELSKADESDDASIADELIGNNNDTKQLIIPRVHLSSNLMNNELIKGALNEWLTWKRPQLINTWQYYQFLRQDMLPAFQRYGIDEAFILAIMAQESGGKVHSRSRAGAGGLFQIMPATARRLGLTGKNGAYDLRFNPEKSALAAAKYLNEQLLKYEGDKAKVLAAYNSGETRFARLNKRHKNKSLWKKNFYYELPRETRHYVPVVLAAMMIFQNPDKFNVKLDTLDAKTVQVELPK
ncbi:MAG TPA: lytic transglycosylase domain-containing protein, partial [Oceanospirillales bacterium]|nr:lytic transglycosylase domain-containing protein [Oceanospirillales bacterium]